MSKYDQLTAHLQSQAQSTLELRFEDLERILGFRLPDSARMYRPWWANQSGGGHAQSRAWMSAGWQVWKVDLAKERVEFRKRGFGVGLVEGSPATPANRAAIGEASDLVTFDRARLSLTARRILDDYTTEFEGDVQAALDKALHEARIAFRQRLLASIPRGTPSSVNSVDLIREDRDFR